MRCRISGIASLHFSSLLFSSLRSAPRQGTVTCPHALLPYNYPVSSDYLINFIQAFSRSADILRRQNRVHGCRTDTATVGSARHFVFRSQGRPYNLRYTHNRSLDSGPERFRSLLLPFVFHFFSFIFLFISSIWSLSAIISLSNEFM